MAQVFKMKNEETNVEKDGIVGFSWTMFFFSWLVPLLRGDFFTALVIGVISIFSFYCIQIGQVVEIGFLVGILLIIVDFKYNAYYTAKLIKEGFRPVDEEGKALLEKYKIKY